MHELSLVSDADLLGAMPKLVLAERARSADVIEHLVEIDRRRRYLQQACGSLSAYCIERLGYSEDEASKRVRVARIAGRLPRVLAELRTGAIHLTGLFLLAQVLTDENCEELLLAARGKSKRQIEELIAQRFPQPDLPTRISPEAEQAPLALPAGSRSKPHAIRSGAVRSPPPSGRVAPRSESRWAVQFTASAEFRAKIERAQELLSHSIPNGDLAEVLERALDALIERETKRRLGANKPRKRRPLAEGSRHIPVEVARAVWERDGGQCTFVDAEGRRCTARRFVTFEHLVPFALGGEPTVENLCLRCMAHNAQAGRDVFGDGHVDAKIAERRNAPPPGKSEVVEKARRALRGMGFRESNVRHALASLEHERSTGDLQVVLRAALRVLVPDGPQCMERRD